MAGRHITIPGLPVLGFRGERVVAVVHGRAGHAGLVTGSNSRAVVVSEVVGVGSDGAGARTAGGHLGVAGAAGCLVAVAAPEGSSTSAAGVVVAGAGAEALLLLVVAGEEELDDGGDEEEEDVDERHGKYGRVQAAHVSPVACTGGLFVVDAPAQGGVDESLARVGAVAGVVRDGGEAPDEADVEEDGDEGKEPDRAEEDGQQDAEDQVQAGGAGHALNGLFPCGDVDVVLGQHGEEVAEDAEDDGGACEFEDAQTSLAETKEGSAKGHCGGGGGGC